MPLSFNFTKQGLAWIVGISLLGSWIFTNMYLFIVGVALGSIYINNYVKLVNKDEIQKNLEITPTYITVFVITSTPQ